MRTTTNPSRILILYDTESGNTYRMAQRVARGVNSVANAEAVVRAVPKVGERQSERLPEVPATGAPWAEQQDLADCDGLILGSPTHFGLMSAAMKHFIDQSTPLWFSGGLRGKPAAAFTSTGSMHGGQEQTLLTMLTPLLHHGMLILGLPYSEPELMQTTRGGTPYGASHVSGESGTEPLDTAEETLCRALGARVARFAEATRGLQGV
ncbi:MAG: NAD(P)H-quinone oxidoreductase [Gammaproteobacteria bacterium]|nr:MAG: NAD(P)H-quinone oxidoreductase [Gammaproteobacteria bacterium]